MSIHTEGRPFEAAEEMSPSEMWIDSASLANGFSKYNQGLGVPAEYQQRVDDLLGRVSADIHPELSEYGDHQRRVGGYAGVLLPVLYPQYDTPFHIGLIRISGAIHDVGKEDIDEDVFMRSFAVPGYGTFERDVDMSEMEKHATYGYLKIAGEPEGLPPEAAFIAGCHHQFPDIGQQPYGIELAEIYRQYRDDPDMARWIHCGAEVVSMADYFDATSRKNLYFASSEDRVSGLLRYMQRRRPGQETMIIDTLLEERAHYLRKTGHIALAA